MNHKTLVAALTKSGEDIALEITGQEAHLLHMALGIGGELGALLDAVKKHVIYNKPIDRENIIEGLGNLEYYLEGLRQGLGITREETIEHNTAKLIRRYGRKYSDASAKLRLDKL